MSNIVATENTSLTHKATFLKDYQAPTYLIDAIDLNVDLYSDHALVKSTMRITRNNERKDALNELCLHGEELELVSVVLNGKQLNEAEYQKNDKSLIIYNMPDSAEVEIVVKNYPQKNTALSGLYRSNNTFCTQCEAEGFRRITYYQDRPDVMAVFTTTITADKSTHPALLSNGNPIDSGELENNRHWVKWHDPFKKPSYLFALVAGDFDLVDDEFITMSGRKIDLRFYVDKGFGDQVDHAVYSLKEAMKWDEEAYGREYDLDIYMIVAIGDFVMGAMENKGLNIFNTKYVLAKPETATDDDYIHILSVIGHEYFHNWSGNRVTCRDWFQLSLKEGLTIFRDQNFSEDRLSESVMRIRDVVDLRESQFPEDAGPLAHSVQPDSYIEINNFYTATIYNKGAEVLRMLRTILGHDQFRKAMDLYFERFDGHAATIEDYVGVMQEVSGIDLTQFKRWYKQAGTPVVTVHDHYDAQQKTYTITFNQQTSPTPSQDVKPPLHMPVKFGLLDRNGNEIHSDVLQLKDETQSFVFNDITDKPIPSLFREFSAPVVIRYNYSDNDLIFLAEHDQDAFNRWEAIQQYMLRLILKLVSDIQNNQDMSLPEGGIELVKYLLKDQSIDPFLLATMLMPPSENYIGEQMQTIDVDGIHEAREFLISSLALALEDEFKSCYQRHSSVRQGGFDVADIGRRLLKNRCLFYLLHLKKNIQYGVDQFNQSLETSMADTIPALVGIANLDVDERQQVLDQFYSKWKDEPLVVDKWLAIQATSSLPDTLNQVKMLLHHESFDIKNPNKVYSLIAAFGHRNPSALHDRSGDAYVFIREVVQKLDALNPQVAGRVVKPLTKWRRYDKERQAMMREQLEVLSSQQLSPDLYELVSKSL